MSVFDKIPGPSLFRYKLEPRREYQDVFYQLIEFLEIDYKTGSYKCDMFVISPDLPVNCTCGKFGTGEPCLSSCAKWKSNFVHIPTGLRLKWDKYPLNNVLANINIELSDFRNIIHDCINFVRGERRKIRYKLNRKYKVS